MVRASLVKSDFLMRSLGRPNRDQIVSVRPERADDARSDRPVQRPDRWPTRLQRGAENLLAANWKSPDEFVALALSVCPQPRADAGRAAGR